MGKLYPGISPTAASRMERIGAQLVDCPRCSGSGFEGRGTGYGDVCSHCGGQKQIRVSGSYASMSNSEQQAFTQSLREARKRGAKAKAVKGKVENNEEAETLPVTDGEEAQGDASPTGSSDSESSEHSESENAGG